MKKTPEILKFAFIGVAFWGSMRAGEILRGETYNETEIAIVLIVLAIIVAILLLFVTLQDRYIS